MPEPAIVTHNAKQFTGTNGVRILAEIDVADIKDADRAFVVITDPATKKKTSYYFEYDAESMLITNTGTPPYAVKPANNAGAGCWVEASPSLQTRILYGTSEPPSAVGLPDGTLYLKII